MSFVHCKRRAIAEPAEIRVIARFLSKSNGQQTGRSSASDEKIDNNTYLNCLQYLDGRKRGYLRGRRLAHSLRQSNLAIDGLNQVAGELRSGVSRFKLE